PTAHILVKNISLTATSTDPGTYAPSVADNHAMLASAANYGAIQGFPVEMYLNGVDQGLYTFNTRKDNNLMNMDSSNNSHILVDVETITLNESAYALNGVDGSVITPDATADVIAAFNRLAQFVNESADADFVAQIAQYVDLYSVIDTAILRLAMENIDGDSKSILYGTYDGRTWFTVPYDLDSTWQLYFDGSNIQPLWNADHFYFSSKLLSRVINLFPTQVKKRYIKLRQRTLSAGNINKLFKDFIDGIPTIAFDNNETIWPAIPSIQLTDFAQIQQSVTGCLSVADKMLNAQIVSTADGSVVDT
ncbi:CotH kinase family protein, partial [Oenococcus oeni]